MEKVLEEAHRALAIVAGAITLALVTRRGVTRSRLSVWAGELREVADKLERIANG